MLKMNKLIELYERCVKTAFLVYEKFENFQRTPNMILILSMNLRVGTGTMWITIWLKSWVKEKRKRNPKDRFGAVRKHQLINELFN